MGSEMCIRDSYKMDYEKVWRNIMSDKLKVGILGGTGVLPALLSLGGALLSMYLMLFAIGLITTITEWHKINASISRKVLSVFTFPIFMFTYIPVSFAALFVKVEWKPIRHTVTAKELGRG